MFCASMMFKEILDGLHIISNEECTYLRSETPKRGLAIDESKYPKILLGGTSELVKSYLSRIANSC